MAHFTKTRCTLRPLFGPAALRQKPTCGPMYELETAIELDRRLKLKYRGYERAAAMLDLDGERDAAKLLRAAAERVKLLRPAGEDAGPERASPAK